MIVRIRAVGVLSSYTKGGNATAQVYIYLIKSQIGKVYKTSMISIQTIVLYFLPDFGGGVRLHDPNALRGNRGGGKDIQRPSYAFPSLTLEAGQHHRTL